MIATAATVIAVLCALSMGLVIVCTLWNIADEAARIRRELVEAGDRNRVDVELRAQLSRERRAGR